MAASSTLGNGATNITEREDVNMEQTVQEVANRAAVVLLEKVNEAKVFERDVCKECGLAGKVGLPGTVSVSEDGSWIASGFDGECDVGLRLFIFQPDGGKIGGELYGRTQGPEFTLAAMTLTVAAVANETNLTSYKLQGAEYVVGKTERFDAMDKDNFQD
jgi:hypothetical protein